MENITTTKKELHLVLGGSGAIGAAVLKALKNKGLPTKAVERSKRIDGTETLIADLSDLDQTKNVIKESSHVYLCVGLPYSTTVWRSEWPKIMKNVIDACANAQARLIFFDNVYMYGPPPLSVPFNENSPQNPTTNKGKIRKAIADMLLEAHRSGKVKAVIGRSADFYGPNAVNSPLYISFLQNMLAGKFPQALARAEVKHTYAYTEDNGKALVALALDDSAYGEVWHLPAGEPITIDEIALILNKILGSSFRVGYLPSFVVQLLSLFVPQIREVKEMLYQFETPYVLSFDKFKAKFPHITPTPYEVGMKEMVRSFKKEDMHK